VVIVTLLDQFAARPLATVGATSIYPKSDSAAVCHNASRAHIRGSDGK
jgi:hypothetical protein